MHGFNLNFFLIHPAPAENCEGTEVSYMNKEIMSLAQSGTNCSSGQIGEDTGGKYY